MKILDTNVPIDVLVENAKFPEHDVAHDKYLSNVDITPTDMFELKDVKYELPQVSWVTKNQLLRSRRFPEVQCLDVTCETNKQNLPLA